MQNWQKHRNYRKHMNPDGSFRYVITVEGRDVEITEAVYKAYSQSDRRERYCVERDAGRLLSLERLDEDDVLLSTLTEQLIESAEDTVIRALLKKQIIMAFDSLAPDERHLIQALKRIAESRGQAKNEPKEKKPPKKSKNLSEPQELT
jgi:hypothetical protein